MDAAGLSRIQHSRQQSGCELTTAAGDRVGTPVAPIDPRLAALTDIGDGLPGHEPLGDSPARDGGNPVVSAGDLAACEAIDQRGVERPQGDACDIGAIERRSNGPQFIGLDLTLAEDSPVTFTIPDRDTDGDPLGVIQLSAYAQHGHVLLMGREVTYTPHPNYNGSDAFALTAGGIVTATFNVTVLAVNDPPEASDDIVSEPW